MISFQGTCHRRSHLLLFRPELKVFGIGQKAASPKHFMNVSGKPLFEIFSKRDHRCPLPKAVLPVSLQTGRAVPWRVLRSSASVSEYGIMLRLWSSLHDLHDVHTISDLTDLATHKI